MALLSLRSSILSNVWADVRYALRTCRRNPGFAAAVLAPIALGIGINTGVFSILNSVAFRPLPTPNSTALISVYQDFQGVKGRRVHGARALFSAPEYRAYRDGAQTLSGVLAYTRPWSTMLGGQTPEQIEGVLVSCNYFDVLQLRPAIGIGFTPANCDAAGDAAGQTAASAPAVILSHAFWRRAFNADPDIVRKTIVLNGRQVGVAGVAPEGFEGIDMTRVAFFGSLSLQTVLLPERDFREDPQVSWLTLVARRRDDVEMSQVRAELAVIAARIDRQQPGRTTTLNVAPARSLSLPVQRQGLLSVAAVVLAAFGLVLLIACANVANVLLARAAGRTREIAVRLAVGASRFRLIQQLLTETLVIAVIGGLAGMLLAWWSFQTLLTWLASSSSSIAGALSLPRVDAQPNLTVLWFALALIAATVVICGLVPALQASKQDVHAVMKQDTALSGRTGASSGGWLRGALISIQIAVCMVLLISAGLLLRALYAAQTIDPGFTTDRITVVSMDLRGLRIPDANVTAFKRDAIERIAALPGVDGVAQVDRVPLLLGRTQTAFRLPGADTPYEVDVNTVSPEYFSLIGIPIVRGRTFTPSELDAARPDASKIDPAPIDTRSRVVIVTEATARRYWPGQDPIGRSIVMDEHTLEIVGIARDAHVSHVGEIESSYMYLPARPSPRRGLGLIVRSQTDIGTLAASILAAVRELDPGLVPRISRLQDNLDFWRTGSRLVASLSASLSVLALALASGGVYGVVSYVVTRRRREVGIRMTLGATARDVQRLILRQTLSPVLIGLVIGITGAAAASQVLKNVLFGISPLDPIAFAGAALCLTVVAFAAIVVPTRAALSMDPMTTLRCE